MMTLKLFCASLFVIAALTSGFWASAAAVDQSTGSPARASIR